MFRKFDLFKKFEQSLSINDSSTKSSLPAKLNATAGRTSLDQTESSGKLPTSQESLNQLIEAGLKLIGEEEGQLHAVKCNACGEDPLRGDRYRCLQCENINLCHRCLNQSLNESNHRSNHAFVHLRFPNELFGREVSEKDLKWDKLSAFYANDVHPGIKCRACNRSDIKGLRFKCDSCVNWNLCETCVRKNVTVPEHSLNHPLILTSDRVMMKIEPTQVELHDKLGRGGFGSVYKARWIPKDRQVACKVMDIATFDQKDPNFRSFCRELKAYIELSGGYILKSYAYAMKEQSEQKVCMLLMEYMKRGTLVDVLSSNEKLSLYQKLNIARQIASGMAKIHNHGMVHRDIRPDNILINEYYTAKIGDMGITCVLEPRNPDNNVGCGLFMPPEFYTGEYNEKLDVFTYGLTLNRLFTEIEHEYRPRGAQLMVLRQESPIFGDLIKRCIETHPDDRPTSKEIEITMILFSQAFYESCLKNHRDYYRLPVKEQDARFLKFYYDFRQPAEEFLRAQFPPELFSSCDPSEAKRRAKELDEEPVQCPIQ